MKMEEQKQKKTSKCNCNNFSSGSHPFSMKNHTVCTKASLRLHSNQTRQAKEDQGGTRQAESSRAEDPKDKRRAYFQRWS